MTGVKTETFASSREENSEKKNSSLAIWLSLVVLSLLFAGALSATYYSISYEKYLKQKSEEKATVVELISAFVSTYSGHRTAQTNLSLPVPATFRALSLMAFEKKRIKGEKISVQMVGVPGLAIKTEPSDEQIATIIRSKIDQSDTSTWSDFIGGPGNEVLRTIKPVKASKPSCVSCHNKHQTPNHVWKLGDTMGAYVLDVPASAFFSTLRWETGLLAAAIMMFGLSGGAILIGLQNRYSRVQARIEHESERGDKLSKARDEARSLSAQLLNANQDLEAALTREKNLNELQRQFVSMASHEFRTPLSIIDGVAQRMKRRANKNLLTPEDALQRVEKIRDAVKRMTRLMDSTLSAASMDEGKFDIEIGACDIGNIVREVCARQQEIAETHVISYDLVDLPATIQADTGSVEQMLTNLLSNAVKYAPDAPGIEVTARMEGRQVEISVRDHGIGIDAEELGKIGERFFRAKTSTGIAGTGIGLNLVSKLVEMHGGSMITRSKKGEGSTFTICLPIDGPEKTGQAETKVA